MKVAIGQDSHRFEKDNSKKLCILGGVPFPEEPGLIANSDGDVVLHALTNAISGITCINVLGGMADKLCQEGIIDSAVYVGEALKDLKEDIAHVSFTIECARPKILPKVNEMRESIAKLLDITPGQVGITATTGEGLTEFGKGNGVQVFCVLTTK